mgnify:CR=1 FL=1
MGFADLKNKGVATPQPTVAPTGGGFSALKAVQPTVTPTVPVMAPKLTTPSTGLFSGASATAQAGASVNPVKKETFLDKISKYSMETPSMDVGITMPASKAQSFQDKLAPIKTAIEKGI